MLQLKKIKLSPYVVELWVIISDNSAIDIPKINKKYPGLNITWDEQTAAWTNDHFYEDNILGVAFDISEMDPDTIAHEAVHITNRTFEHAGYKVQTLNDEHQAYFVGWIVGEIHKALKQFQKKQKK